MDAVIRSLAVYLFLIGIFRLTGKRTIAQITTFDFVLLLIISEATQQALMGEDFSVMNSFIVITTLLTADLVMSYIKDKSKKIEKILDGVPLVLVTEGKPIKERLQNSRVDENDILEAARELRGLEKMEQIKYAVLEKDGQISIIPYT